jgi:hypothetical protein
MHFHFILNRGRSESKLTKIKVIELLSKGLLDVKTCLEFLHFLLGLEKVLHYYWEKILVIGCDVCHKILLLNDG